MIHKYRLPALISCSLSHNYDNLRLNKRGLSSYSTFTSTEYTGFWSVLSRTPIWSVTREYYAVTETSVSYKKPIPPVKNGDSTETMISSRNPFKKKTRFRQGTLIFQRNPKLLYLISNRHSKIFQSHVNFQIKFRAKAAHRLIFGCFSSTLCIHILFSYQGL